MNQCDEWLNHLDQLSDHETLSRWLEPYLTLIKSQILNLFYTDLRYHKGMYREYLPILIKESKQDYRLEGVLERFSVLLKKQVESQKNT
jgi:hypothetical protein